jgi:hypothetical protein
MDLYFEGFSFDFLRDSNAADRLITWLLVIRQLIWFGTIQFGRCYSMKTCTIQSRLFNCALFFPIPVLAFLRCLSHLFLGQNQRL